MRWAVVWSSSISRLISAGFGRSPGVVVSGDEGTRCGGGVGVPCTGLPGTRRTSPGAGVGARRAAGEESPGRRWADGVGEPSGLRPGPGSGATEGGRGQAGGVGEAAGERGAPGVGATEGGRSVEIVAEGEASSTSTTGMSSSLAMPRFGVEGGPAGGLPPTPIPPKSNFGVGELVVGMRRCAGGVGDAAGGAPGAGEPPKGGPGRLIAGGVGVRGPSRTSGSSSESKSNADVSGLFCEGGGPGFGGGPGLRGGCAGLSGFGASLKEMLRVRLGRGASQGERLIPSPQAL
ncbi:MAG: protein product from [Planctomycetota bacterium]|nr:MAG: protein product from [Planctomycetota bacterium]